LNKRTGTIRGTFYSRGSMGMRLKRELFL